MERKSKSSPKAATTTPAMTGSTRPAVPSTLDRRNLFTDAAAASAEKSSANIRRVPATGGGVKPKPKPAEETSSQVRAKRNRKRP